MHAVLYRSRARPGLRAADLNAIIDTAETQNRAADVTGLLLYGTIPAIPGAPGQFVQWIEGPEDAVERLFEAIRSDARHVEVEVLARGDVAALTDGATGGQRLFPSWSMGLVRLSELPATAAGFLTFAREWDGAVLARAA